MGVVKILSTMLTLNKRAKKNKTILCLSRGNLYWTRLGSAVHFRDIPGKSSCSEKGNVLGRSESPLTILTKRVDGLCSQLLAACTHARIGELMKRWAQPVKSSVMLSFFHRKSLPVKKYGPDRDFSTRDWFSVMKKMPWVHCVDCFEIDGKCVWLISTEVIHCMHCDH